MIGIALSVAAIAKVVKYLVEIALPVAVKVVEYLVEIALSVAAKVEEYLVGIDLSVVAAKVVEYLVGIALALSVVAAKVVEYLVEIALSVAAKVDEYLVGIDLSVVAAKVVEYLVAIALSVAAKVEEYLVGIDLSVVAVKVVEYLVEIALALSVVAAKVVEYLVEIALSVAVKVEEYLVGIDLSVVAAKVEEYLVGIGLSVVAAKVVKYLVGIALTVVAKKVVEDFPEKVVEYLVAIALSVAAKVAEFLVGPIARPFGYIWHYKTNFDNLKNEARKLKGQEETVQNSVELARKNGDQIKQNVSGWLVRVKRMTDEVSEVIKENEPANMKCFKGLCPNPKKRYQHSRNAVKKAKAVARLYEEGNFPTVFIPIPKDTWIPSHIGYEAFESRKLTLKEILDALSNPNVNMVGIYGAGGIGKTMLAKEIAQYADDKMLFNVVAFAEVAVQPDTKEIQKEIADKLGLTFTSEESVPGRARRLQQRLKQEEKVLLVLDNIWARLTLEEVGIPFGDDHKGCKLLLTARSLDVLSEMHSESNFQIGVLDKGEAWSLFKKRAGVCIENNDCLQALARKVAEVCGGFPIAINSVAVALKNKEASEWKDALEKLTTPSKSNFEGVTEETYSSIEISYSQIKEKQLKSTFLLCCIMEYTDLEALLDYGKGLGIFEDVNTMEKARNRVNTLVRKLKDSSLLLDINNSRFSLHDVVRYVGRSIASREGHMFTVANNDIPREWVDNDILKNCVGISLYNISKLPEEFECPELQFFYLRTTSRVPVNFFKGMPKLKVLHLAGLELYSVPTSICLLVNLWTLYIDNCKLRDIDFIGEFKQLEILRIHGSYGSNSSKIEIEMIPKKMGNLTGLRLLDLKGCSFLRKIPPNVLLNFTRLEELYLPATYPLWNCIIEWEVEGVNILDELKHLKQLTALEISIPDDRVLPEGLLVSNKLERYNIFIGNCSWYVFYFLTSSRIVKLNLETSSCRDVQKFLSVLDGRGFPELEHLHVENSPCFHTVVDCLESESRHHFLFLQSLSLDSVLNLEMIHSYPLKDKADSFRQLRTIKVVKCNKLKNILSFSTYRALPLLEEVDVSSCDNMEEIFAIRREEEINNNEGIDQIEFKHLRTITVQFCHKLKNILSFSTDRALLPLLDKVCVSTCNNMEEIFAINRREEDINNDEGTNQIEFKQLRSLRLEFLPKLTSFCSINGNKDTNLFNQKVAFSSLEEIKISKMDDLETIWPNQLCNDSFCNLKALKVTKCNKLLTIFQSNVLERITRLESLTIRHCDLVEKIFDLQGIDFEESHSEVESQLRKLVITGLPTLKHIWNKDPQKMFSFQKLNNVKVHNCMSLKYLFPVSIAESLSELQLLDVHHCGVEEFVADDQGEAKVAATFVFPRITSLELNYLPALKTFYRGVHTSQWQNLKRLTMCDCNKVELFASDLFNFQENNEGQHGSSVQPLFIVEKVTFPSLEEIEISKSNNLKILWQKGANESFCNLKSVEVSDCNELLTIFQFNTLSMPKLLTVTICNCASVEEIFDLQKVDFEESHSRAVMYPQLQKLYIHRLQKLKHIWKKDPQAKLSFEELPMPVSLTVNFCDSIEVIFDLQKVNFERSDSRPVMNQLKELHIHGLPKLKHIWKKDPQAKLYFEELPMPKSLSVHDCALVEEIFDLQKVNFEESHSRPVTNQLKELWLDGLPKLKHVWKKDPQAKLSFEELPMPESLTVKHCGSIEEIFDLQKVNFEESHSRAVMYPQLRQLNINWLPQLKHIWKMDPQAKLSFEELPMPESLSVGDCDSIEVIFDLQKVNFEESHSRPVMNQLQELYISRLPKLKHIWNKDPQAELSFENLQKVDVSNCETLEDLFPASIARSLSQLVELNVYDCGKLEEIVTKEGEAKEAARFVFPKVTSIRLDRLPELRTFYRGVHSSKWEVLKELEVFYCDKIELLASQLSWFQENNIDISVQRPFFLVEKDSFPILEKLILFGEGVRMISQGQFSEELFCNLKLLKVYNDKSVEPFPLCILQRFHHLQELHLKSSSYKEIFSYKEDETHVGVDSKLDMVLSKLEKLTVDDCQNLIQLVVPSSTSFQNLTVLKVSHCDGLKNLMTSSTAKRLVQLRAMEIGYCKSMIEVVAKGGDVTEDKIIFSKLRSLKLLCLLSLSCFCSANYTFELPSLEEIEVNICSEMKYFSLGDITTPILQKVNGDITLEGDLNTTIQKFKDAW